MLSSQLFSLQAMSPFIERRHESLGNTFFVEALDSMIEGPGKPLRRRHSFSHFSLAHEVISQKKLDSCFRLGKSVGLSRQSNCAAGLASKPSNAGLECLVRSSQTHRTAPAGTFSAKFSGEEMEDHTSTHDGPIRSAPSTANKNDLIKSLSTMGKFALARAATLAKGAPRSSLERFPQLQ